MFVIVSISYNELTLCRCKLVFVCIYIITKSEVEICSLVILVETRFYFTRCLILFEEKKNGEIVNFLPTTLAKDWFDATTSLYGGSSLGTLKSIQLILLIFWKLSVVGKFSIRHEWSVYNIIKFMYTAACGGV